MSVANRPQHSIDLHGLTAREARDELQHCIDRLLRQTRGKLTIRVITGKGIHSKDGAVLPRDAHDFVKQHYSDRIIRIEDSPADVLLGGLPIRGHFDVTLRAS